MEYNIMPPSPCSVSSSTSSGSSPSREPFLRLPLDDELQREGLHAVIQRLRLLESEHKKLLIERSRAMKDVNKKLQVHLLEVRRVREANHRLMQDKETLLKEKEDLAGICCFLDDDREKAKRVAREWQMFGRYCTGVLQKELGGCHDQIKELEQRQTILVHENKSLKELCVMLDKENTGSRSSVDSQNSLSGPSNGLLSVAGIRDAGDGSSNGSTTSACSPDHRQGSSSSGNENSYSSNTPQGDGYLRSLENKIRDLEEETKGRVKRITVPPPPLKPSSPPPSRDFGSPGKLERKFCSSSVLPTSSHSSLQNSPSRQGPRTATHNHPDENFPDFPAPLKPPVFEEKEKAVVKEMRNVAWRRFEDRGKEMKTNGNPAVPRTASISNL